MIETTIEKKTAPQVGEILLAQWGYEASYPEFYKIIKVAGEWVTLQELKGVYVGQGSIFDSRSITTHGEAAEEKPFRRKWKNYGWNSGISVRINSYKYASVWDGKPADQYNHH